MQCNKPTRSLQLLQNNYKFLYNRRMRNIRPHSPSYSNFAAVLMILIGWGGLYFLINNIIPDAGARWLFFVLLYVAITGTMLPFIGFLNRRFSRRYIPDWVILRQSMWCGLYATTCAWLQIPRVLTPLIALLLAAIFVVIEVFIRIREYQSLTEFIEEELPPELPYTPSQVKEQSP